MKASVVNKTTTTTTNTTTTTTTGLKIDQLNSLLKIKQNDAASNNKMTKTTTTTNNHNSSVSLSNSHSRNLANLREVLELAHKLNQTNSFSSSATLDHSHKSNDNNGSSTNEQSLSDLIDLLSSNNSTTNNNNNNSCSNVKKLNKQLLEASKIQRPQPQQIINRIEKELEESLRLLKMYNGGEEMTTSEEKDEEDKELHEFDKIEDSSSFEEMIMTDRNHGRIRLSDDDDDDEDNETTSNDSAQSSSSPQSSSPPPSINVAAEKKPSFNRNDKIRKNCTINKDQRTKRKNRSPKEETTSQIESSCNKIVLNANKVETEPTKTETTISSSNEKSSLNSTNWNYDELNELKMKFISLLSSSNSAMLSEQQQQQTPTSQQINILLNKEEKEECAIEMVSSPNTTNIVRQDANQIKQQLSPTINRESERIGDDLTVPDHELQKIESFYQSFGTLLYLAKSSADLYTISNVHTTQQRSKEQAYNRNSIATSSSIREEYTSNSSASNNSSCSTDIKDECLVYNFIKDRYKNLISVRHRGLPLWLFNTGSNPRRPVRQLKFTLAEKGTGFILWQDRIDTLSSFKLFLYDKLTDKVIGIESLAQYNKLVIDNSSMLHSSTVVFKFRASDKKTNVLVRFDLSFEAVKFNEYFKRMICTLLAEVKQRAKSLPTGIGGNSSLNITTSSSSNVRLSKLHHQKKSSSDLKTFANRSTATMSGDSTIRLKRITKSDISTPCNLKHIISLKSNEKNAYYTLSKLLPTLNSSSTSSTTSSSKLAAMPSPTSTTNSIESSSSVLSSSCSPTSSSSASNISPPLSNNPKKTNRLDFVKVNNSTGSTSLFIHSLNINNSCYNNSLFLEEKSLANL